MKKLPFMIFLALVAGAVITGIGSYKATERHIRQDVEKALAMTMMELPCDRVDADTIRCYRSHVTIAEVRNKACIAVRTVGNGERTELIADHGCDFMTVLMMSDQRAASTLLAAGLLWILLSTWYARRRVVGHGIAYGGWVFDTERSCFMTADGKTVSLTPMQLELLTMFFKADSHTLSKQEICDRLWPKKPDASETLYTLIRRLKQVIESQSNLRIESERGKTYRLTD